MQIGESSYPRRNTRQVMVGKVPVGGGAPISVQSMTITKTADVEGTLQQIYALAAAGADISSEERRVGKECVSTCRFRWLSSHVKKNYQTLIPHLNHHTQPL